MNKQQLLEIVRRQLKEMITDEQPVRGVDCDAVTVPHTTATDLGAAPRFAHQRRNTGNSCACMSLEYGITVG